MTFTAVVTAHAESPHRILGNLLYQTRKPDEILVYASDVPGSVLAELAEDFPLPLMITAVENRNDWGHEKRAQGVSVASGDYLGFFNQDDEYELDYLEKMLQKAEERSADAVFCGWSGSLGNPRPEFALGSSTSGNFIVSTRLARRVGYWGRTYEADGQFIDAVRSNAKNVAFVDEVLYHHH